MMKKFNYYIICAIGIFFLSDIIISDISILPDIIGYGLLIFGGYNLVSKSKSFNIVYILSGVGVIISIALYIINAGLTSSILRLILMVLDAIIVYQICSGISDVSRDNNVKNIYNLSMKIWKAYLITMMAIFAMALINIFIFNIAASVASILAYLMISFLLVYSDICFREEQRKNLEL